MEIICKVVLLGNLTEGSSPRGAWRKQDLIVETVEQYPKKICLVCWNDRVVEAQSFTIGQIVKAQISIESREFNGKWYTDVRPFRFDVEAAQPQQPVQQNPQNQNPVVQQQMPPITASDYFNTDNGDDLPF